MKAEHSTNEVPWTVWIQDCDNTLPSPFFLNPQQTAAWLLGEIGPPARAALPALAELTPSGRSWTRVIAARAVWKIEANGERALPALRELVGKGDELAFYIALETFKEMRGAAREAAPDLIQIINEMTNSWCHRRQALDVLRQIDPAVASAFSLQWND